MHWLEGGILLACWLVRDYLQGPGVSAARRPLLAPLTLGLELVRAHLGPPLNIHPCHPGQAALHNFFLQVCVLTLIRVESGPTNGPELAQTHLRTFAPCAI